MVPLGIHRNIFRQFRFSRTGAEDGLLYAGCAQAFLKLGDFATATKMARRAVALLPLSAKVTIDSVPMRCRRQQ